MSRCRWPLLQLWRQLKNRPFHGTKPLDNDLLHIKTLPLFPRVVFRVRLHPLQFLRVVPVTCCGNRKGAGHSYFAKASRRVQQFIFMPVCVHMTLVLILIYAFKSMLGAIWPIPYLCTVKPTKAKPCPAVPRGKHSGLSPLRPDFDPEHSLWLLGQAGAFFCGYSGFSPTVRSELRLDLWQREWALVTCHNFSFSIRKINKV